MLHRTCAPANDTKAASRHRSLKSVDFWLLRVGVATPRYVAYPLPSPPPQGGRGLCRRSEQRRTSSVRASRLSAQIVCNGIQVLIAAAGEIDHHQVSLRLLRREVEHAGERVRRL